MIDFVKFAEAKNASLITFCSIWIGSILTILRFNQALPLGYEFYLPIVLPLFMIATIIALSAFFPRLLHHFHKSGDGPKNLLFFGDIATFAPAAYAARLRERYLPPQDEAYARSYLDDLEIQIAVHGAIAARKFRRFNCAALVVMAAFAILAIPAVLEILGIIQGLSSEHAG